MTEDQKAWPPFQNKAPLKTRKGCKAQQRHQVHLVSMTGMPWKIDGDTYNYIISAIETFSRLYFCLCSKQESAEVAEHLLHIHNEHGLP